MFGTLKNALQRATRSEPKEWDASLEKVLYGCRRRPGPDGVAPFEILFGVKPRFAIESPGTSPGEEILTNARPFEPTMALINRDDHLIPRIRQNETHYQIGKQPVGSKVRSRIWLGLFEVISVEHPRFGLETASGRNSQKPVHFRVYVDTNRRKSNILTVTRIVRMVFSSPKKTAGNSVSCSVQGPAYAPFCYYLFAVLIVCVRCQTESFFLLIALSLQIPIYSHYRRQLYFALLVSA